MGLSKHGIFIRIFISLLDDLDTVLLRIKCSKREVERAKYSKLSVSALRGISEGKNEQYLPDRPIR